MIQRLSIVFFVLASLQAAPSLASNIGAGPGEAEIAEARAAIETIRDGHCDEGLPHLQTVESSSIFAAYPDELRVWILEHMLYCLRLVENSAEVDRYVETLVVTEGVERPGLLRQLIWSSIGKNQLTTGVDAVKRLAKFGLTELQGLSNEAYFSLYGPLLNDGNLEKLRYDFLRTLFLSGYTPGNPFEFADEFMFAYAVMSIDRGDTEDLKQVILAFTEPGVILRVRVDRRFDGVRQDRDLEAFLDLENANNRYIAKLEGLISENPQFASGHILYSDALAGAWKFKEALDYIEPIAWKVRTPFLNRSFVDLDSKKNWVLETYAAAMWREKYPEQSEDMFKEAFQVPENNEKNVSQQINLAARILYGGNLELALALAQDLLDSKANTSPYGAMWVHTTLVCAKVLSDTPKDFSQSLVYLIAHERDNPGALIQAFLCTNEMDAAAELMIRRLESLDQRTNALLYMQYTKSDWETERRTHVHETLADLSPGHMLWHRLDVLRERTDVVAVANRVGRIEVVPLHSLIWHSY